MTLADHLKQQATRLQALIDLLQEERDTLLKIKVDGARLSQLAEEKREYLKELEEFEQKRRHALRRIGYSDDRAGDEQAAIDANCLPLWQSVRERAGEVAQLNRTNGILINIRAKHNRSLLDFLQKIVGRELYGPDGRTRSRGERLNSQA